MTAKTVTFAIQIGSGGFAVARAVAERLNYRYYDSEVSNRAASEAGVSPTTILETQYVPPLVDRLIARLGAGLASRELATPSAAGMSLAIQNLRSGHYRRFTEHVVKELASQGEAVIVGHAGQVVLQKEWSVCKVLIIGSGPRRAQRLAVEEHVTSTDAQKLLEQSDRERTEFFKTVYHVDLLNSALYDLCLNTDTIALDSAVELIINAAKSLALFPESAQGNGHGAGAESVEPL